MKLSYNWLKDFLDLSDLDVNTIANNLTMRAFEVEGIEKIGDKLEGPVVLGEIREITKHPDADRLQVTKTYVGKLPDGSDDVRQIVCGASNIKVGQRVPVALVGSTVVDRHNNGPLPIKKSKIRGVESQGMLCSPDELGYSEEEAASIRAKQGDGIYILGEGFNNTEVTQSLHRTPALGLDQGICEGATGVYSGVNEDGERANNADLSQARKSCIGEDIRKVLGFETDYVLEIGARSNRGDALSVIGQAREIAALFSKRIKEPLVKEISKDNEAYKYDPGIKSYRPKITDNNDCSVFYTVAIENLKVCESPQWLQKRLAASGSKSINNVVDISNYILLELGQPMHFYDRAKLQGDELSVRRAKEDEEIITLDDKKHKLSEINLVIADSAGPVCLAGAMGGSESQITESTSNIIIEAAVFTPASVRKSARAAGLESEAKRRFERGVDKTGTKRALLKAVDLLAKYASEPGSKISVGELLMTGSDKAEERPVNLRLEQVKKLLGIEIDAGLIIKLLEPLGIKFLGWKHEYTEMNFGVPSFRQTDITREVDLIEEIGRLYGFDKIQDSAPSTSATHHNSQEECKLRLVNLIKQSLVARGFSQAILSSLVGETLIDIINSEVSSRITMDNPLSKEHSVLRQSLIPGLIQAASRNYAYDKSRNIKLFELGKVYAIRKTKEPNTAGPSLEQDKLAAIMVINERAWNQDRDTSSLENFCKFKAVIEDLYPGAWFTASEDLSFAHPNISALVKKDGKSIGSISKLHPSLAKEWDLPEQVYIMELDLPKPREKKFRAISNTPIVERDITVDSKGDLSSQSVEDLSKKHCSKDLLSIELVSFYQKAEQNSSTYRLRWQAEDRTLSGEEIDQQVNNLKNLLEEKLAVKFRE
jgi:phenylalanyl-tRNA synthetase beta chain